MNIPNWFYDERVQQIAPEKLNLLLHLAAQLEGKTKRDHARAYRSDCFCQPAESDVFKG